MAFSDQIQAAANSAVDGPDSITVSYRSYGLPGSGWKNVPAQLFSVLELGGTKTLRIDSTENSRDPVKVYLSKRDVSNISEGRDLVRIGTKTYNVAQILESDTASFTVIAIP